MAGFDPDAFDSDAFDPDAFDLGDVVPVISGAFVTDIQATTVDLGFATDTESGTGYYVVTESATQPSVAQIQAGQDHTGAAAVADGSTTVSAPSVTFNNVGTLTESTTYYAHFNQASGGDSNVISTGAFVPTTAVGLGFIRDIVRGMTREIVKDMVG